MDDQRTDRKYGKSLRELHMRFSLSQLLVAIAIVAILCGWWFDHRQLNADRYRLNAELHLSEVLSIKVA
jgi:hypothetical protein